MGGLTPRYESITGADLTGSDGDSNRTYTLTYLNYYSVIEFLRQGSALHETEDFTISGRVVTFLGAMFDSYVISLRYFTSDASTSIISGYGYASTAGVYRTAGITSTEVGTADVSSQILAAEVIICRITKNIYWNVALDEQTATGGSASTIVKTSAGWTVNDLTGLYVWIYSGTGSVQIRKITSNTADTITVDRNWTTTNPASGSLFKVFYVPTDFNPFVGDSYDGSGMSYQFLPYYPVKKIETLTIGLTPVTVTPSNLYLYEKTGKIQFKTTAEASIFSQTYPQEVAMNYWYGVDHLPYDIKRLVELKAAMNVLAQQMGGTFDDPATVGFPEFNVSVGQAYINIEGTIRRLQIEYDELLTKVKVWPQFG
jgi:hypothetical protein